MDAHSEKLLNEYKLNMPSYLKVQEIVTNALKDAVKKLGMYVTGIESRVKEEKSLIGKLELKGLKYHSILDITDIVGARVITFYNDEIDTVAALVEKNFTIDWNNSVDKRKMYDNDRFGYMSLHYICTIPESLYKDDNNPLINTIPFEIQIKTALQHVWATINHDMGYKSDVEIPREYKRSIFRLAGLLEIADEEFKSFKLNIQEYRRKVLNLVKDGKFDDIALDGDSFKNYLQTDPFDIITKDIASTLHADIEHVSFLPYLPVLDKIGIKTLGDIERMKKDFSDDVKRLILFQMGEMDIDIISSTIVLMNLCFIYSLKNGGGEKDVKEIYDILYGNRTRNINSAKRIIEQIKSLNII